MTINEIVLLGIFLVAAALVVAGVAMLTLPGALVTAGVIVAVIGVLFFYEVPPEGR